MGRHTYFDFGPPNDYYEIYLVRQAKEGSEVERITLTPEANKCYATARTEYVVKEVTSSVIDLLGSKETCKISKKELKKEQKRKKKGLVFSGADVALQVQCGMATRIVRADILDRDWFAANPNTPKNTSWTMKLLDRLDHLTGPTVMDKPAFGGVDPPGQAADIADLTTQQNLSSGKFDELFAAAPHKPSVLYKESLVIPPKPTVQVVSSTPALPTEMKLPGFPPLARMVSMEGLVSATLMVDRQGNVSSVGNLEGPKLLLTAADDALRQWKFAPEPNLPQIAVTLDFKLNCHTNPKP